MKSNYQQLVQQLTENLSKKSSLKILAGFDAFVDTLVDLVQEQTEQGPVFFKNLTQFGQYIQTKSGTNFSLETIPKIEKIGGNMLIMSQAMAKLGVKIDCLGNFGQPAIHPVFEQLSENIKIHSFGQPGTCMAIECGENKLMLANMTPLNNADWTLMQREIGLDKIQKIAQNVDAFCLLNWGELLRSNQIWQGFYDAVLGINSGFSNKILFIDLSDFSNRNSTDIKQMFELLKLFCSKIKVVISLNINELNLFTSFFNLTDFGLKKQLFELQKVFEFEIIVLHSKQKSYAVQNETFFEEDTFKLTEFKRLTGAGDHFNAGFLAAYLSGSELNDCLQFGNALAGAYIEDAF